MKHWIRLLCLSLLSIVVGTASAQKVAKIGSTEYATIEEAVEAWGPGKTLTLLANVQTSSTVTVEVNATKSTQNWTLDLGDYTWTANGCNAFQLYAAGGTVMNQNYGLKVYANQNGGIKAAGKYCIEAKYDNSKTRYRPRLEIHGGTYEGAYIIYYYSSSWSNSNIENGPSTHIFMSNDGTEPIFNGNFGMYKCPLTINAGYFNGTSFNTYPVGSTADTYLKGGHFKTISAFPSASNNKGIQFGNYKVFVKSDASIDIVNGAPATYEAKATKTLLLSSNQGINYSDYVYYEKADDAIQKYSSGTIEIVLAPGVTATQDKSYRSGTLTIDASAEGSDYTGDITLTSTSAKFVVKFPEGGGHYGVTASTGTLHVEETVADGVVTRTYSVISRVSNPEAKVGDTSYSTVYDAFYAVDGTTDNKTIVLQKDVTNAGIITNGTATGGDGKTVATFDLNGKSIGIGSVAAGNNADYTLTIIDSSEGKTGTVTNSDASLFILALTGINDYSGSYTLKIQAGTWQFDPSAVNINGEIHNLVDEGYFAKDNGNGTWTVGELPSVAKIGDAKYPTLQSAVDAAQQIGGAVTVNIIDDISGETVTIKEVANFKLTIDGQKDASSNYTVDAVIVVDGLRGNGGSTTNGASVTLQNIAFVKTTATDGIQASHYPHHLTIQDCTYSGSDNDKWFLNASVDGPLYGVTVKDVTVEHARLVYANMADDAVFQNITATNDIKVGFNVKTSGTALIENCQVTTGKYAFRDYSDGYEGTFTLKDNTFISTSEASDEGVIVNRGGTVGTAHVNVESGTYTGHIKVLNNKEGVLAISGGYFSEEFPQEYIAADLVAQGKVCAPATDKEGYFTIGDPHYVAQIGETKYVSLQAALDAAHEMTGDVTITLLDDISNYSIVHQKAGLNLTIDGADKKVTSNIIVDGDGRGTGTETLNIQNIKFEGDGTDFCSGTSSFVEVPSCKTEGTPYYTNKYNYAHNITVTNCSFTSTTSGLTMAAIRSNSGAGAYNVVISDCTGANLHSLAQLTGTTGGSITGNTVSGSESFVNVNGGAGDFTISGNTFTSAEGADGYGVRENGSSTAVITLTDNTFTATNAVVLGKGSSVTAGTINVISGTYVGDITKTDAATGKIVITDGHFCAPLADPAYAEFIAEGLCGVNGLYPEDTAAPNGIGTAVATVTTGTTVIPYASLEAAFAAATDGATITLLTDCTGNGIKAPQDKFNTSGLTVDFAGFTYTVDGETVGSTGTETNGFQLLKDNKITFKNGTITSEKAKILVQNYSDLTLEGMTLTLNNAGYTSAYTLSNNNGSVVIDGSTINANPAGGFAFDVCRYSSYPSVNVTVKGESQINGDVEVYASGSDAKDGFGLMFEAGTFNGEIVLDATAKTAMANTPEKATVSKNNELTGIAAPTDYKWVDNGDGTSTLAPCVYVAQIGETKYETLEAAVAAAQEGETVEVLVAGEYSLPGISKNITIEGTVDGVVFNHTTAGSIASIPNGATFKNVAFEVGNVNYHGFQHAGTINMENCTINGKLFSYGDMNFTNCAFNQTNSDYHMWAYAGNVTYTGCTFTNTETGKFVNVYNEDGTTKYTVTATDCKFINKASSANKAALNVKATSGSNLLAYDVIINNCTTEGAFPEVSMTDALYVLNNLVQVDDRTATGIDNITVTQDDVLIYPVNYVAAIGNMRYETLEAAFAAAQDGTTITILQNITLSENLTWNTEGDATLTLDLGEYKITKGNYSVKLVQGQTVNASKSAGIFTTDEVGYYVKSTKNADDTYTYTVEEADLEYTDANGKVSYKAWSNTVVSGSGTYKLLKDITAPARIAPGIAATNITLDLNGHTLTSTATDVAVLLSRNGTSSSPKTFDIIDSSDEKGGKLIANTAANMAIQVSGNYNTVTIGEGVTIDGGCVGLMKENETLVVNGTINGGDDYAVVTNGSTTKNANITIKDGAVLTSDITAMYLAGNEGLVATIEGGSITGGDTGIEIRAGQLTVTGGTITSTASEYSCVANANGTTTEGAAVAVVQHTTQLPINVTISDGSLSGVNNIIVSDIQNGSLTDVEVTVKDELIGESVLPTDYKWVSNGDGTSSLGLKEYIAQIGSTKYETLQEAVDAAGSTAATITLLTEAATEGVITGAGVKVPSGSNITFDLNGLTYDVNGETVGSTGYETQGFQLLNNSDITFKNGTLKATSPTAQMVIQNYSNLTLEDVNVDGTGLSGWAYALSNNSGTVNLTGSTSITAKSDGRAFDTCKFGSYAIPTVNINTTGAITGTIEATGGKLNIKNGKFDVTWVTDSHYTAGDIQISGGVFSEEPAEEYLAEGYVTSDNEDEETKAAYPYAVMTKEDAGIFELVDGKPYPCPEGHAASSVTYRRSFSTSQVGKYQAWFVPVDYTIQSEDEENFQFYKIHMIAASAEAGEVSDITAINIYIEPVGAGTVLRGNRPYVVKPKAALTDHIFTAEGIDKLYAVDETSRLHEETTEFNYDFYGTYDTFAASQANEWFAMNGGQIAPNKTASAKLGSYRWYIKVTPRDENADYANVYFNFVESEETTAIDLINADPKAEIEGFYTVGGVKHDKPIRGTLNIVKYTDGKTKKVYIK